MTHGLMADMGIPPIILFDSLSALYLARDQVQQERLKHIDIRYHFICTQE